MLMMSRAGTHESDHSVIAVAHTQWFVYVLDRPAQMESWLTPSGLFSYHTSSDSWNFSLGFWKKACCSGLSLSTYLRKHENVSPSRLVLHKRVCLSSLDLSVKPSWWFLESSLWDMVTYSMPSASLSNWKLPRQSKRWPSLPLRHQYSVTKLDFAEKTCRSIWTQERTVIQLY